MSRAIIYSGNSNAQTTTVAGTTLNFGNIVRRYGCGLTLEGGNIVASEPGYYEGDVNVTIDGTDAGTVLVQVYENGVAVPYAYASAVTSATSVNAISIPFVIRTTCKCQPKTITVQVSGVATSVVNASIVMEKE